MDDFVWRIAADLHGHVRMQAGDVVALAGTLASIDAAREVLARGKAG